MAVTPRGDISKRDANSNLHAVAAVDNGGGEISEDRRACVFIVHRRCARTSSSRIDSARAYVCVTGV